MLTRGKLHLPAAKSVLSPAPEGALSRPMIHAVVPTARQQEVFNGDSVDAFLAWLEKLGVRPEGWHRVKGKAT